MSADIIARYIRHATVSGLSNNTISDREELLRRVDADIPGGLAVATLDDLEDWLGKNSNWKRWTIATYRGHIRAFFKWRALRYAVIDPSVDLVRPRTPSGLPKPVTLDELRRALTECREPWRTYCTIAAYSGARACEIARLHRDDIDRNYIRLFGKGDKERRIPMREELWHVVNHKNGLIARNFRTGGQSTPNAISVGVCTNLQRIGMKVSLHQFRHFFATWMLMPKELGGSGADLRTVQELMGHADPATTALYTLVTDQQCRLAVAGLPSIDGAVPRLSVVRNDVA